MNEPDKTFVASITISGVEEISQIVEYLKSTIQQLLDRFLNPIEKSVHVICDLKRTQKVKTITEIDWDKIANRSSIQELAVGYSLADDLVESGQDPLLGRLSIGRSNEDDLLFTIEVGFKPAYLKNPNMKLIQQKYVDWFLATSQKFNGVVGFITYDYRFPKAISSSPYETSIGMQYLDVVAKFHEQTRGYYWGNFLNLTHIQKLGGEGRLEGLSVYSVQKIDSIGYYIQLTDTFDSLQSKDLAKLKSFLKLLMPKSKFPLDPKYEQSWPYMLVHD